MTRRRGYTVVELMVVIVIAGFVLSAVAALYAAVTRAVAVESTRGQLLASSREVLHQIETDVRGAQSLSSTAGQLTLMAGGQRVTYANSEEGVVRQMGAGRRVLGTAGTAVSFAPVGSRGVTVSLRATRTVRSRTLALTRELTVGRRSP